MKINKLLKTSLLVVFIYFLMIIGGLVFNANQLLLLSINTFTPIKIINADGFRINYQDFSIELQQLDFHISETEFNLRKASVFFEGSYFSPSISRIQLKALNVVDSNENQGFELETKNRFNLKEYSPSFIFEKYHALDISIGKITYHKKETDIITVKDLIVETRDKNINPYLYLSLTLPDFYQQTLEIESRINNTSQAEFLIRNNESTDIKAKLIFDLESDDHISISGEIESHYGPRFAQFFNQQLLKEDLLNSMEGSLLMNFTSVSNYEIDLNEKLASQIHVFSSTISSKQTTSLNQSLISSIHSTADFSLDLFSNGKSFDAKLKIPKAISIDIKPNKKDKKFKANKTLNYLASHTLNIKMPSGEIQLIDKDTFRLPENIRLSWSQKGNPAYLDLLLNSIHGKLSEQNLIQMTIDYKLSGRWNKFFSSEHSNIISLNNITPEHNFYIKMKGFEKRLHTHFLLTASRMGNHASGKFSISSKDWKQEITYLNEMLAFWNPDLNVIDGDVTLNSDFSVNNINDTRKRNISYQGNLSINKTDIDNDGFIFHDISFNSKFKGYNRTLDCIETFPITVQLIDAGFIIKSFSLTASCHFDLKADSYIDFSLLKAKLFSGEITGDNFRLLIPYNSNTNNDQSYHGQLLTHVKNIQLKEVLAVMENPEIQGDGLLYGELPIRFDEKVTLIENGWIKNSAPGSLSYKPNNQTKAMLRQNPQMKLMVDVLGNLDYNKLHAKINLNNQGTLSIQGELMGVNKKYKSGAPINFNPNIELDFTDLIKSLQISDNISQSLDNKVNEKTLD